MTTLGQQDAVRSATVPIPAGMERLFVGREAELAALRRFVGSDFPVTLLIDGPRGIGKTWLVQWFFHSTPQRVPRLVTLSASRDRDPRATFAKLPELRDFPAGGVLVVDDLAVGARQSSDATSWLAALRKFFDDYPRAKAILISRGAVPPEWKLPRTERLTIGPFTKAQFHDFVQLHVRTLLPMISDVEMEMLYNRLGGNPQVAGAALQALMPYSGRFEGHLGLLFEPVTVPGIVGPDGRALSPDHREYRTVVTELSEVSDYVLNQLSENPAELYKLSSRFFEQVVAEIFQRKGYDVTLTAASKDGGKDIYAARNDSLGTFLFLIECKKYSASNPVGVELVRSLYGVVSKENATAGILATTSHFTRGAQEFGRDVRFRIALQDFFGVHQWLREVTRQRTI